MLDQSQVGTEEMLFQEKVEESLVVSVCGFHGTIIMARWLSWLERRPVTAEVMGSNPIRVVF